jgi:ATP-dependent DNA helicase RecQ
MVYNSLKILQREGYLEFTEEVDSPSRVYFTVSRDELYKFQVANSDLDGFIKLILRSYTGLFTGYVAVDEELLAKRSGLDQETVYNYLKHLRKSNVIDYVPRNRTPFIYFMKERVHIERLKISKENYDLRKKELSNRIESVIEYASSSTKCRSQILLEYFGETDSAPCGTCDVCKSLESMELSSYEFETIGKEVKKILTNPTTYENLLLKLKGNQPKKQQVVKWLLDNHKIVYRIDNQLEWLGE